MKIAVKPVGRVVLVAFCLAQPRPAWAYMKFGVHAGDRVVALKWAQTPVPYYVFEGSSVPGVSLSDFEGAVARAFARWQAVPTAAVSYRFVGLTAAHPGEDDGLSTLGFESHPEQDGVLASTSYLVDSVTGALIESDIFFNTAFAWSVAANGEAGRYDLESIAQHETGHFGGLGHSALGETELTPGGYRVLSAEAIMFPIAFSAGSVAARTLKADDIAGVSDIYPGAGFAGEGSLSGRVTKNGNPIFGAHIVAFDPATRALVGGFTLTEKGEFSIGGLSPGPKVVRVEPLDDAGLDSFFDATQTVDVDFRVLLFGRLVVVPAGGDSGQVELPVVAK
jgi:hypothetical protein